MPERFVLLDLNYIGDILFTTPAIRAIRERCPDSHIAVVVIDGLEGLLLHNPHVDEVIPRKRGLIGGLRLASRLRKGRYDTSVVFSFSSVDVAAIARFSGARRRIGFDRDGLRRFLNEPVPFRPDAHRVDAYLDLARAMGADLSEPKMEMFVSEHARAFAAELLESSGVSLDRPIVALSPGSTRAAKQWFPERYAAVADRLADDGMSVIIVGSAGERETANAVLENSKVHPVDLCGRTGLGQLAAVLERCSLVIGNDTGPMHMAVSVGAPVVVIFGPTDATVFGPYGRDATVLREIQGCFPCGYDKECKLECLSAITVDRVYEAAKEMLAARRVGQ